MSSTSLASRRSSPSPAAAMPSTSRIVAQVKVRWPVWACIRASAVHLWALTCGRSRGPGSAAAIVVRLRSSAAPSTSKAGVCRSWIVVMRASSAEHGVEIVVCEHPVGVDLVTDREEVVEAGVRRAQILGGAPVHLAPMGSAAEPFHLLLHSAEVGLELLASIAVDRDVGAVAPGGGRQRDVVRRGDAHL